MGGGAGTLGAVRIQALAAELEQVLRQGAEGGEVAPRIEALGGELVALAHEHGYLELEEHSENGTHLVGWLPVNVAGRFMTYQRR